MVRFPAWLPVDFRSSSGWSLEPAAGCLEPVHLRASVGRSRPGLLATRRHRPRGLRIPANTGCSSRSRILSGSRALRLEPVVADRVLEEVSALCGAEADGAAECRLSPTSVRLEEAEDEIVAVFRLLDGVKVNRRVAIQREQRQRRWSCVTFGRAGCDDQRMIKVSRGARHGGVECGARVGPHGVCAAAFSESV